jgi:carbamoyltransferase
MSGTAVNPSADLCFRRRSLGPARNPDAPIEDRHRNLAFATQAVYEDGFFHLLNTLQRRNGNTAVALAGGCAYNSVANGKIKDRTPFTKCYLQAAAGDAGGAIGAAYVVWHQSGSRASEMTHAFWGPSFTNAELAALLTDHHAAIRAAGCTVQRLDDPQELVETTAPAQLPRVWSSAGFKAAWSGDRGHLAIARSSATHDAPI